MIVTEDVGVAQREAWANKVLPPVEQVRDGLWSIPVPMPDNPLRYVLVYALALDDGLASSTSVGITNSRGRLSSTA